MDDIARDAKVNEYAHALKTAIVEVGQGVAPSEHSLAVQVAGSEEALHALADYRTEQLLRATPEARKALKARIREIATQAVDEGQ